MGMELRLLFGGERKFSGMSATQFEVMDLGRYYFVPKFITFTMSHSSFYLDRSGLVEQF